MNKSDILKILDNDICDILKITKSYFKKFNLKTFELCSITNAKSGLCNQDCKFCAQSKKYNTDIDSYPLKNNDILLKEAESAKKNNAQHFGIVTSGNIINDKEIDSISKSAFKIKNKIGLDMCVSLGSLTDNQLDCLKQSGITKLHHNIETSENYFNNICTTHSFKDRVNMIKKAKNKGFKICSGGIFGAGETMNDRIDMAFNLKKLNVDSVPLNILVPIKGTPYQNIKPLSVIEIIKSIAAFRLILEDKTIKLAAGRETLLKDFQPLAFLAGVNGILIGGYLTIKGRKVSEDIEMLKQIKKFLKE